MYPCRNCGDSGFVTMTDEPERYYLCRECYLEVCRARHEVRYGKAKDGESRTEK